MIFSHSLVILFFPAVVSPPVRERWRSFSPGSCPRSWAVCCSCWHRSRWNLWAGGRRASRHPARPSSRPWSAWCCRPSSNRPAPHRRTAPGCWRWWSFSAGAAARSSTSSWSTAAAGTRCLTEEKQIEAHQPPENRKAVCALFTLRCDAPVTWMYWGLFSEGKLKAEAEYLSCTKPNLEEKSTTFTHFCNLEIQTKYLVRAPSLSS